MTEQQHVSDRSQAAQTREGLVPWAPEFFAGHDPDGVAGMCHFAPNCGGVPFKDRMTRPSFPTCPSAPAEFASRTGMLHEGAGFERYVPLCRARAVRDYGSVAVAETDRG